jgi:hypothetical protein
MSDMNDQESTPLEIDVQVIPPTGPDPEPAEGALAEPAPKTDPDPEPAEGALAKPAPTPETE